MVADRDRRRQIGCAKLRACARRAVERSPQRRAHRVRRWGAGAAKYRRGEGYAPLHSMGGVPLGFARARQPEGSCLRFFGPNRAEYARSKKLPPGEGVGRGRPVRSAAPLNRPGATQRRRPAASALEFIENKNSSKNFILHLKPSNVVGLLEKMACINLLISLWAIVSSTLALSIFER